MPEINDILKERGSRYGDFGVQSQTAQAIREAFKDSLNWEVLPPYMREGLDLVAVKISRMLCGDFMYMDNVVDIIGYMTLVKTEMEKEHARIEGYAKRVLATQKDTNRPSDPEIRPLYAHLSDGVSVGNPLQWRGPYSNT